jgi:hypothetical protein
VQPLLKCSIDKAIPQWSQVHDAFSIRDKIIHGASVPVTLKYATPHVNSILGASESREKIAKNDFLPTSHPSAEPVEPASVSRINQQEPES